MAAYYCCIIRGQRWEDRFFRVLFVHLLDIEGMLRSLRQELLRTMHSVYSRSGNCLGYFLFRHVTYMALPLTFGTEGSLRYVRTSEEQLAHRKLKLYGGRLGRTAALFLDGD